VVVLKNSFPALLIFLLLLVSPPLPAQTSTVTLEPATAAVASMSGPTAPVMASPRDTLRLFMTAMNEVKNGNLTSLDKALATLHLDEIPETSRDSKGPEMADQLFQILNSFTFKIDALPVESDTRTYVLPVGREKNIDIVLYRYDSGEWKFNYSRTLSRLEEYLAEIKKSADAHLEDTTIDPVFFSPRETMRLFMLGMAHNNAQGFAEAAKALDLSVFERTVRVEMGVERAIMLKAVLDRHRFIDLVEFPNESHVPPVVVLSHDSGRIILEKVKNPDSSIESWKFSAQTVKDLPKLYDAFKDRPIVEGITSDIDIPLSVQIRDYMRINFPGLLHETILLENWQWLGIFCVVFLGLGFSRLIAHLLKNSIKMLFRREEVMVDFEAQQRFITPISVTATTLFWWGGLSLLGLPGQARVILVVSVKLISALAGVWAGYRMMDVIGNFLQGKAEKTANKFDDLLVPLITRALKTMVIIFGLLFIADIFAVDINKLLAGLGLGGLAFALAAKDTVSNIFGSLTILIDRPFQIGDWVTIGSADGTVESVGVRSTRIRTFYNSLITIPNAELINAHIDNYGARQFRRITTTVSIAYDTPPEKIDSFCEGIRELIRKHPYTRKDFFIVSLNEFGASALGIMVYCFVKTPDWNTELQEKHRLFTDIIRLAKVLKVEFAFPTQTLYLRNEETPGHENLPGDRKEALELGRRSAGEIVSAG